MSTSRTFIIVKHLYDKFAVNSSCREFFHDKVIVWALWKYFLNRHPSCDFTDCTFDDLCSGFKIESRENILVSIDTLILHERIIEAVFTRNVVLFNMLIAGPNIDRIIPAIIGLYFGLFDIDYKINLVTLHTKTLKLLLRIIARHQTELSGNVHITGKKIGEHLTQFQYKKTLCYAAGAHCNKKLCCKFFDIYPQYKDFIVRGANEFHHQKLVELFGTFFVSETLPSKEITMSPGIQYDYSIQVFAVFLFIALLVILQFSMFASR